MKLARAIGGIALLSSCAVLSACGHAPESKPMAPVAPAATSAPGAWAYEVDVSDDGRTLDVVATFPVGTPDAFSPDDAAIPFVERVEGRDANLSAPWHPLTLQAGAWSLPCPAGCALRYRLRLGEAARALEDPDGAMETHGAFEAPPSTWLVRPNGAPAGTTYRFHVTTHGAAHFATGVHRLNAPADTYGASADEIESAPYTLFGAFRVRPLKRDDATIDLAMLDGAMAMDDAGIDRWIDLSARAVTSYYGHFPVKRLLLVIAPAHGAHDAPPQGRTLAGGGASILMGVSDAMTAADIPRDWVLTHEMTHLASPSLPRSQHWLEEGMATYVEPMARAQVGTIPGDEVWQGLVEGLPNGQPAAGDEGLDRTHTWGRTYWGGALFCFLADLEIHKRTNDRASFQTAMRGVLDGLGSGEIHATIDDELKAGDKAVGVPVLEELHARLGEKAETIDLAKIWSELGIRDVKGKISYDDKAPMAALRRAMVPAK